MAIELKIYFGKNYDEEKNDTKKYGMEMVCEACGLSHITGSGLICPVCFYEWFDGDDAEFVRERYFNKCLKQDAKEFRELKVKYEKEFGENWKERLQEDNFLWFVDEMIKVY